MGDPLRIQKTIPTLRRILDQKPRSLIIMSHLGRPKGNVKRKFSLQPVVPVLESLLGQDVRFETNYLSEKFLSEAQRFNNGEVILLENLRFNIEEEGKGVGKNKKKIKADKTAVVEFRRKLSALGDVYIFDAFGTAHRAHSSVVGVDLPVRAAGLLMKKELESFGVLEGPRHPFVAILGGAKVADKIPVIKNLLRKVSDIIIGGGMAFTFVKVLHGVDIGNSLYDEEGAKLVPKLMEEARLWGARIHLPDDFVIAREFKADAEAQYSVTSVPKGWMGLDIGTRTITRYIRLLDSAQTIVANGPMGVFEWERFSHGTWAVMAKVAQRTNQGATTIIGGGDSALAAKQFGLVDSIGHVSTGGGASLELLQGKILPGIAALSSKL